MNCERQMEVLNQLETAKRDELQRKDEELEELRQLFQQKKQERKHLKHELKGIAKDKENLTSNVFDLTKDDDDNDETPIKLEDNAAVQDKDITDLTTDDDDHDDDDDDDETPIKLEDNAAVQNNEAEDDRKPAASGPGKNGDEKESGEDLDDDDENESDDDADDDADNSDDDYEERTTKQSKASARATGKRKAPHTTSATNNAKKQGIATAATCQGKKPKVRAADKKPIYFTGGKTSVGKTRTQLNNNTELVERMMGTAKFGQAAVCAKNMKIHAVVLNDDWNELATSPEDKQEWYVGIGSGRKTTAVRVGETKTPIPIYQAPTKQKGKIFYVGHYTVESMKEFEEQFQRVRGVPRQMLITFKYDSFSQKLADVIAKSP
ncbi:MAG: hypothetical protein SGILL_005316 [Bacillariaceae sp.]